MISWEILEHAVKVAKKNLPHATHRGDLLLETDITIEELLRDLPDVIILVAAGFPCQDNSDLKKGKMGIRGEKSKLIMDIAKFRKKVAIAQRRLSRTAAIHCLWENVMGTSDEDVKFITSHTVIQEPIVVDAAEASHCWRTRIFWPTWRLKLKAGEQWGEVKGRRILKNWGVKPDKTPWGNTEFQVQHHGKASTLPICTRTCPGPKGPESSWRDHGIETADSGTIRRWKEDGHRLSTYQYAEENLLWKGDWWRMPYPSELDELLGFPQGYTEGRGHRSAARTANREHNAHVSNPKTAARPLTGSNGKTQARSRSQ